MTRQNYNVFFTVPMVLGVIAVGAVMIPIFLFGMGATIKSFQFMFSPATSGSIPVWAIFVAGILVMYMWKQRYFERR